MVFKGLSRSIGATPLLAVRCNFRGHERTIYAKSEQLNLTGSIKDRMALHVLRKAYENGSIQPGFGIAEATSGNTGISFSAIGRALGHRVTIFMPDWMSEERKSLIRSFGAEIVQVSHEEGGFLGSIAKADEMAEREGNVFLPHQFSNLANCEAHEESTGPEIWYQLKARELEPNAFIAGVGTGGTVMGAGRFLRSKDPTIKVHPLEPKESPTLSTGCKVGKHRIQGISDEFIPDILDLGSLDSVIQVSDGDSILMARALASQLGLGVGISSGANFLGALLIHEELGPEAVVSTVFCDDNKKYLSTDLFGDEPIGEDFISPEVELLSYDTLRRSCRTCSDLEECRHWVDADFRDDD
ncbi:MAG: PLP-dependent cysteine synthase family protein [Gemmatimonadetes bacterium]|nr:PLP-dependent cysteine synthase family protein [Gemmatimonadota bacterium]NNM05062.1 PLP-dependent cysteine synthase family protein [Gemmatimonadota bacterium]